MTALSFVATKGLLGRDSLQARRLGLALAFGNLVVPGVFKYYGLFATTLNDAGARIGTGPTASVLHMALPLGISFYTFNLLGYAVDVYREHLQIQPQPGRHRREALGGDVRAQSLVLDVGEVVHAPAASIVRVEEALDPRGGGGDDGVVAPTAPVATSA